MKSLQLCWTENTLKIGLLMIWVLQPCCMHCAFCLFNEMSSCVISSYAASPIEGQVYTTCGLSCPLSCDNISNIIGCDDSCWQGCECLSGTGIWKQWKWKTETENWNGQNENCLLSNTHLSTCKTITVCYAVHASICQRL